jgi:hypothetical protein
VCRYHGGSTAHVKQKARERLEQAADLMALRVIGIAVDDGIPPAVALAAAKDALDRAGVGGCCGVVLGKLALTCAVAMKALVAPPTGLGFADVKPVRPCGP